MTVFAAPGQKRVGLAHQRRIIAKVDLLGARRRAALDLIEQARPGAAFEERIAARAQQKRALQRVDGAVDRPHRGERPVITARPGARAAMLENLRRPVIGRDQDIGKRFVVAQHHVEARPQPLDQIGLEQQRLGLGAGDDEFERAGGGDHALDAGVETGRAGIGGNALFDVLRLADIEHVAARIDHAIDARPRRRELGVVHDRGAAGGKRTGFFVEGKLRGFGLVGLRQRLLVVFLDDLGLGRDFWLRDIHARECSPDERQRNPGNGRLAKTQFPDVASLIRATFPSDIDSLNDINLELLTNSALFNLNIAINSSDRTNGLRRFL